MQQGTLRRETRSTGEVWVLRYMARRDSDGKRVERTLTIASTEKLPTMTEARTFIQREGILNQIDMGERPRPKEEITFGELAALYVREVLDSDPELQIDPLSHTTVSAYRRVLSKRVLPRWRNQPAAALDPLEAERWLLHLRREGFSNQSLHKTKTVMLAVYRYGIQRKLLPFRSKEENPVRQVRCPQRTRYRSMTVTPAQARSIWEQLAEPERTLVLLVASTGIRISEALGLKWGDVDWQRRRIQIVRAWSGGREGLPKTEASERVLVIGTELVTFLSRWHEETPYAAQTDWVFPSFRLRGRQPRTANMLVEDHLRPAAVAAGVLSAKDTRRFGFHTLRHSLASWLTRTGASPVVLRDTLGHANVNTSYNLYSHTNLEERRAAQSAFLGEFFGDGNVTGVPENTGRETRVEN